MMFPGAVASAAAVASMLATGLVPAQAATGSGWKVAATIGKTTQFVTNLGLDATSAHNAWSLWTTCTVGTQCDAGKFEKVLAHWNGSTWATRRPATLQKIYHPRAFGASSASNIWVFGGQSGRTSVPEKPTPAYQWNGRRWVRHTLPAWVIRKDGYGDQGAVAKVFSPSDLWVFTVGVEKDTTPRLAGHYNGHRWVKYYLPAVPGAISAVSRNDMWAVGSTLQDPSQVVLMHWNGKTWSSRPVPTQSPSGSLDFVSDPAGTGPRSVSMLGAFGPSLSSRVTYLLHWNGSSWQKVLVPAKTLSGLAPDGHGGWWTVNAGGDWRDRFLHRSNGRWTRSSVPALSWAPLRRVDGLVRVPGTTTILAYGDLTKLGDKGEVGTLWQRRG
jgi:hypothetical protein